MTGHVKGNDAHTPERLQGLVDRGTTLIQMGSIAVQLFSPSHWLQQNKKRRLCCMHNLRLSPEKYPLPSIVQPSVCRTKNNWHLDETEDCLIQKRREDQSLYSNYTFTTLIDRFTSLRTGAFRLWSNQLIKFELLTQSIRQHKVANRQWTRLSVWP